MFTAWLSASLLIWPLAMSNTKEQQRHWVADVSVYGYELVAPGALTEQGLFFVSSDRIAVYQVLENDAPALQPEDEGKDFRLQLEILDAADGHEIRSFRLPTAARGNSIAPLHDGKILVKTGEQISLYSPDLVKLAARKLPFLPGGSDFFDVRTSNSGRMLAIAHYFSVSQDWFGIAGPAEIETLNADTFATTGRLMVPRLNFWSVGDGWIVCWDPMIRHGLGTLDNAGRWSPIRAHDENGWPEDVAEVKAFGSDRVVVLGWRRVEVYSSVEKPFRIQRYGGVYLTGVRIAGHFLATQLVEGSPDDKRPGQIWIDLYDLESRKKLKSLKVENKEFPVDFDVSSQGDVVIRHGLELEVFRHAAPH